MECGVLHVHLNIILRKQRHIPIEVQADISFFHVGKHSALITLSNLRHSASCITFQSFHKETLFLFVLLMEYRCDSIALSEICLVNFHFQYVLREVTHQEF